MYVMTIYRLIYTKLSNAAILRQWNKATAGCWNQYVVLFEENRQVCDFLSFGDEACCTDMLTFLNRMADFVLHNSYCSSWPMKWHAAHFCTVLLTCCVAAWTDCWLCDSVQKYLCTVTSGGFADTFKSNCPQIFSPPPPPAHHCHHPHHHYIFSRSTNCIAERKNMCKDYTIYIYIYIYYIYLYIYTIYTYIYIYYIYFSTFTMISHSALPKIINVADKIYLGIQNTHFM